MPNRTPTRVPSDRALLIIRPRALTARPADRRRYDGTSQPGRDFSGDFASFVFQQPARGVDIKRAR